jgi:hypothetical protein
MVLLLNVSLTCGSFVCLYPRSVTQVQTCNWSYCRHCQIQVQISNQSCCRRPNDGLVNRSIQDVKFCINLVDTSCVHVIFGSQRRILCCRWYFGIWPDLCPSVLCQPWEGLCMLQRHHQSIQVLSLRNIFKTTYFITSILSWRCRYLAIKKMKLCLEHSDFDDNIGDVHYLCLKEDLLLVLVTTW